MHADADLRSLRCLPRDAPPTIQIRGALTDVNNEFRQQYERILAENGTRVYKVKRQEAFNAMRIALARLAMRMAASPRSSAISTSCARADPAQSRRVAAGGRPRPAQLREVAKKHVGLLAYFVKFEPEGLEIVINATTIEVPPGHRGLAHHAHARNRSAAFRHAAPRQYPPPSAVRIGLDKIWRELEAELKTSGVAVKPR